MNVGSTFTWALITRRSVQRAGARLFSRGIDKRVIFSYFWFTIWKLKNVKNAIFQQGYCSNFVETEQIIEHLNDRVSFVQIRGSIPLYWSQYPTIKYKPALNIDLTKEHFSAALLHVQNLTKAYGRQIFVNLVSCSVFSARNNEMK